MSYFTKLYTKAIYLNEIGDQLQLTKCLYCSVCKSSINNLETMNIFTTKLHNISMHYKHARYFLIYHPDPYVLTYLLYINVETLLET